MVSRSCLMDRVRSPTTVPAMRRATTLGPQLTQPELQAIVSKPCDSEDSIDDALRAYLSLVTQYKGEGASEPELQDLYKDRIGLTVIACR